ncbi:MAG: aminotransferase class V-fold PLP-dependent enzyme [Cyclobacteriaceae bacterium]|jgi:selenocysteine lyase/cysteine desulfurase|nr:aminotransferase class V-fold PLP-dependent enzyme [Flammeovirgaceae bacterium]
MLSNQRSKFSLPNSGTYLNGAYMSPLLKSVEKAGLKGMLRKRNPFSITPTDFFTETEKLRTEYARLINVKESNRIVIIPSVSYGIATVAKNLNLSAGDNVIVAAEQFPSNYYSWSELVHERGAELKVVSSIQGAGRGKIWNERILESINSKTKLVALGHVHWADGTLFQLTEIRKRTRDVGALLVIDGTQSVGALPFDVQKIQPDALICAGYKWLMGPYSIGLAYYGDFFDNGKPLEENWINRKDSENFAGLVNYQNDYQPSALRYEVGEHSNFIAVPMLLAAIQQINQWKPSNIQAYCEKISRKALAQLTDAGFWIEDPKFRGHHLFGIRLPENINRDKVVESLKKNKISVSFRGDAIRVAPHVYNSETEMNKLASVLKKI